MTNFTYVDEDGDVLNVNVSEATKTVDFEVGYLVEVPFGAPMRELRDFVNNLPEHVFADPPTWSPGDVVTFVNDVGTRFTLRRRADAGWDKFRNGELEANYSWTDFGVTRLVSGFNPQGYRDVVVAIGTVR